ncbi:hypothetical protein J4729_23205 [Leisingera sp. HS039]|uniref:hypothetical protein n=1 Tax=unclassified Leisingera TaxID=2614906 RepID=UPI001070C5F8|nr:MULTISPECIES: hypothetical protein [unclassified Leisingera]MBQ4827427.1 hypothetical protein [Leisingera sp. HS039]QBR37606.1 hypothetical protein ETW23_17260 [Leisingera sp. NJS201]
MKNWAIEATSLVLFLLLGAACVWAATQITGFSFDPLGSKFAACFIASPPHNQSNQMSHILS